MNTVIKTDELATTTAPAALSIAQADAPALIETLSIDELAVREEYAACVTITK